MSKNRTLLSRPRTKVYESNYNAGYNAYKSTLDSLDRKYGRSSEPVSNGAIGGLRASLDREREKIDLPSPRSAAIRDFEEDDFFNELPKRKTNTAALLGEFDSLFENRIKNGVPAPRDQEAVRSQKAFDDEIEEELAASMKRLRAQRAARAAAEDLEEIESNLSSRKQASSLRSKLDFSDKVIDSVGLSGRARAALEDEGLISKRRTLKVTAGDSTENDLTKWTAIKTGSGRRHVLEDEEESSAQIAAQARAQKSRARLEDLEAEMTALAERGAAREKRVRDLKALVQENEASSKETLHSAVRVKSSIQTEKKVVSF